MAYGNTTNPINWETCVTTKAWTLTSGYGSKTVYMKFRDSVLNESGEVNNSINFTSFSSSITAAQMN